MILWTYKCCYSTVGRSSAVFITECICVSHLQSWLQYHFFPTPPPPVITSTRHKKNYVLLGVQTQKEKVASAPRTLQSEVKESWGFGGFFSKWTRGPRREWNNTDYNAVAHQELTSVNTCKKTVLEGFRITYLPYKDLYQSREQPGNPWYEKFGNYHQKGNDR